MVNLNYKVNKCIDHRLEQAEMGLDYLRRLVDLPQDRRVEGWELRPGVSWRLLCALMKRILDEWEEI